jgi:DNA-binding NtrC family response regulator
MVHTPVTVNGPPSGIATNPAISTGSAGSPRGAAVVRWVHPSSRTSTLEDGAVFGRDADATVPLPGQQASRRHAEVRWAGVVPVLRDLESRNGTWVNGQRITERPVGPGDVLRIGEWVGVVLELSDRDAPLGLRDLGQSWYGSATLARAIEPARRVATTDLPVIIEGETGVGKEGMARAVHAWSARLGAFVAVNCAAIPPTMAEAELFGYRKGAFTGADQSNPGLFRAAHRGTLFLDEILDLPAPLQTKLLRVLEQHEVQPLGEARAVPIDVRVVCATQEPLGRAVEDRRFRADLLARLDGLTVVLPPLRGRREDIAPLFVRLLHDQTGGRVPDVDPKLVEALLIYDWPLNIRELVLLVRRLVAVHGDEPALKRAMLPDRVLAATRTASASAPPITPVRASTADDVAFDRLIESLRRHGGNVSRAAGALGISRSRAYRLLEARPEFDVRSLREE